jgi:HlyD family secretion protein
MFKKLFHFFLTHKIIAAIIIIAIIMGVCFGVKSLGTKTTVSYLTSPVAKGTIISSVSGSGQVSALNQIDLTPKVSGEIVYLSATVGQEVKAATLIAQIDSSDAQKTVRDAEASLESAKISLEKLKQPATTLTLLQAENALIAAENSKETAVTNLAEVYNDGFNTVTDSFLDLPTIVSGLKDIFFAKTIDATQDNIDWYSHQCFSMYNGEYEQALADKSDFQNLYDQAKINYQSVFTQYQNTSRSSANEEIEDLISKTYDLVDELSATLKSGNDYINFIVEALKQHDMTVNSAIAGQQTKIVSYINTINGHLSNLASATKTIQTDKDAIISADRTIAEKTESLANLKAGADALDLKSAELSLQQKENALLDAQEKYANYYIRAPFDGVIAAVNAQKGDTASSASAIATLITKQQVAEISLNEVDAAKIKIGQKATLTFDAISDLNLTGQVAGVDTLGTVSQGVVSYTVKIVFDTQDNRIKPGMSVTVNIILESKVDVLLAPLSAVKTNSSGSNYVEILVNNQPQNKIVTTGLSNDTDIEILSGLNEGEEIIVSTVDPSAAKTTTSSSQNSFRVPMGGGFRD